MTPPAPAEIKGVITQIVTLSAPSRIQVVVDMSGSMRAGEQSAPRRTDGHQLLQGLGGRQPEPDELILTAGRLCRPAAARCAGVTPQ